MFSSELSEISKNNLFTEHLQWLLLNCLLFSIIAYFAFTKRLNFLTIKRAILLAEGATQRCSEKMQQIYRRTPMPKWDFNSNFIETALRHGCSHANLLHILGTPKNTSGWLLLALENWASCVSLVIDLHLYLKCHSSVGVFQTFC